MNNSEDIRWKQRFSNYQKALKQLEKAVDKANKLGLSKLEEQGLIQSFEYTHELAWKVMKDYAVYQGDFSVAGSRDAIKKAFEFNLIDNAELWMDTIGSRNRTSHSYNEELASEIVEKIIQDYCPLFKNFESVIKSKV